MENTNISNLILNSFNELVASIDKEYNFTYFNKSYSSEFKKIFGPDIKIGDNILEVLEHLPEEQKNAKEIWSRAINGEEFIITQEFGDSEKERNVYEISYSALYENEILIGASHIVRDITIREKLQRTSEESLRVKNAFLGNVSHELRTPLNSILGFSQLLLLSNSNITKKEMYIKNIMKSGKFLLQLINDVLDLNRIDQGLLFLSPEPVNAYSTICDIYQDMLPIAQENDVTIFLNLNEVKNINIFVDNQRFKQICLNLISNAIKYNKPGGQIEIHGSRSNNLFTMSIVDTGIGIKEENIKKLTNPFERLDFEFSSIQGTGLGLNIVKTLCTMMNGTLDITSTFGKGSKFSVSFSSTDKEVESVCEDEMKNIINNKGLQFTGNIYYIEDNDFNLLLMKQIIEEYFPKCNYEFSQCGKNGYDHIIQHRPDILLLDINVPGMDGIEILKNIKKLHTIDNMKIVVISADIIQNIEQKTLKSGAHVYLSKPLDIPLFVDHINNLIK